MHPVDLNSMFNLGGRFPPFFTANHGPAERSIIYLTQHDALNNRLNTHIAKFSSLCDSVAKQQYQGTSHGSTPLR